MSKVAGLFAVIALGTTLGACGSTYHGTLEKADATPEQMRADGVACGGSINQDTGRIKISQFGQDEFDACMRAKGYTYKRS